MRNLKLKKVRPVATETETLHKNGDDLGLHLVGYSSLESSNSDLRAVKDTPGLHVMGDLYASAVGTTVLQLKEIPPRPKEYDGALCLAGVADVDEKVIRANLERFGKIEKVEGYLLRRIFKRDN